MSSMYIQRIEKRKQVRKFKQPRLQSKKCILNPLIIFISGEIMIKAMKDPMKDFETLPWKKVLKKYDKYSLRSWLAASEGA